MMHLHERVELAKQLLDQAHDLRANARGVMADVPEGRATQLEGRATAYATVALAEMLCQQSVRRTRRPGHPRQLGREHDVPPVVIVAGTPQEAEWYRAANDLTRSECVVVRTADNLRGLAGVVDVRYVGSWQSRRDLPEVMCNLVIAQRPTQAALDGLAQPWRDVAQGLARTRRRLTVAMVGVAVAIVGVMATLLVELTR